MCKKLFLLGAVLALALAAASPATVQAAGIRGTAHELAATGGACAACHLPHGAQGKRLWVAAIVPNTAVFRGQVSNLCGACHMIPPSGNLVATWRNTFHANGDITSSTWVFGTLSHGYMMSVANANTPRQTVYSELPYHLTAGAALGRIECTTCHDVHNNDPGRMPFLRKSMTILCATCHGQRQWNSSLITGWASGNYANIGTLSNWTAATGAGAPVLPTGNMHRVNPGSHPVGADITGDTYVNPNAPITIWRGFKVGFALSPGKWSIAGHLAGNNTGGVVCVSCHTVHGSRIDAGVGTGAAPGANADLTQVNGMTAAGGCVNMLTLAQAATMTDAGTGGRSIANGHAVAPAIGRNNLCEGCHVGGPTGAAPFVSANYQAAGVGTGTRTIPNPGATLYGHPIDDMRILSNWVADGSVWPTANLNWPVGGAAATSATNPRVICESCHIPHPAANYGRVDLSTAPSVGTSNQYMLRGEGTAVCNGCHAAAMNRHHPVNVRYNTVGVTYLSGVRASAMDTLTCGSCHGGAGAHNWQARGAVGLDPRWRPYDNGRGTPANEVFDTVASLTCIHCHLGMTGSPGTNKSPTLHANFDTSYSPAGMTETYAQLGNGSHVMGRISNGAGGNHVRYHLVGAAYWTSLNSRIANLFSGTATWPAGFPFFGQGGWSRFGGNTANPVLVCESCHELQPTRNSTTHLLLGYYAEEPNVPPIASTRSQFCEGCHRPLGTHQQTGDTTTRTNQVLNTVVDANRPWLVTPTDTNVVLSGGNRMTCDTCHQPHDAASKSATFVLDCLNASVGTMAAAEANGQAVFASYSAGYWPTIQAGKGGDHSRFCRSCHQY